MRLWNCKPQHRQQHQQQQPEHCEWYLLSHDAVLEEEGILDGQLLMLEVMLPNWVWPRSNLQSNNNNNNNSNSVKHGDGGSGIVADADADAGAGDDVYFVIV